jgi:hypothetical protein
VLKEISVNIPWMSLSRDGVVLNATSLFILAKVDLPKVYEFHCALQQDAKAAALASMEKRIVDSFKQNHSKSVPYLSALLQTLLRSLQISVENVRIKIEMVDFQEVLGGFELVFNNLSFLRENSALRQQRFEGEFCTNTLNISDLRLKSIPKENLICLKHSSEEIAKIPLKQFCDFFQTEENPIYLLEPIFVTMSITKTYADESLKEHRRDVAIEFGNINTNISNTDIEWVGAVGKMFAFVKEFSHTRRLALPWQFRETKKMEQFEGLRLNLLLNRLKKERDLFDSTRLKKRVHELRDIKWEYEQSYQTKILYLMENEFDKSTEKLYDLNMVTSIPGSNASITIAEMISRADQIERKLDLGLILAMREVVVSRIKNSVYFKSVLLERKKYMKKLKEKTGVISGILATGLSRIWNVGKDLKYLDDLVKPEDGSQEALEIRESLVKDEVCSGEKVGVRCRKLKLKLIRNLQTLLELKLEGIEYDVGAAVESKEKTAKFRLEKLRVTDSEDNLFLDLVKNKESEDQFAATQKDMSAILLIVKMNNQSSLEGPGVRSCTLRLAHLVFHGHKELLSKIFYFSIDLSPYASKETVADDLTPNNDLNRALRSIIDFDEKIKTMDITVASVCLFWKTCLSTEAICIKFVPSIHLIKNEISLSLDKFQFIHTDAYVDVERLISDPSTIDSMPKLIRPLAISVILLRRTSNRASVDVKLGNLEVFISDTFFATVLKLADDFSTIKFLNKDSLMSNLVPTSLKKELKPLNTNKKRSRIPIISLKGNKSTLLNSMLSHRSSRKPSAMSQSFVTCNQDSDLSDEFFDAFEDETDLLAHNELKKRMDLIENAGMMLEDKLETIDERNQFTLQPPRRRPNHVDLELSLSLIVQDCLLVACHARDRLNFNALFLSKTSFFYDKSTLSLDIGEATAVIKQNINSLARDALAFLNSFKSLLGRLGGKSPEDPDCLESSDDSTTKMLKNLLSPEFPFKNIELVVRQGVSIYLTEQIGNSLNPGLHLILKPSLNLRNMAFETEFSIKVDIYNDDVGFYEPLIEELEASVKLSYFQNNLRLENQVKILLLNVKPSILKNLFDILSIYSSQKVKLSAEKNSIILLKNKTGVSINYVINNNGINRLLKPFDRVQVNLFSQQQSNGRDSREPEPTANEDLSSAGGMAIAAELKSSLLQQIGKITTDEGLAKMQINKKNTTSFFSKKKIHIEIPTFRISQVIDLSNILDSYIHIVGHQYLVAKIGIDNFQTKLSLKSNYKITNKMDFEIECSVYQHIWGDSKDDHTDFAFKKRKKSITMSEGGDDPFSDTSSLDLNDFDHTSPTSSSAKKFRFDGFATTPSKKPEEKTIMMFKFVLAAKETKYVPLLKNFPNNYYLSVHPAHVSFYRNVANSTDPEKEMQNVKHQDSKASRVYFQDILANNCGLSRFRLFSSVLSFHEGTDRDYICL